MLIELMKALVCILALPTGFVVGWFSSGYLIDKLYNKPVETRELPLRVIDNPMVQ